MARPKKQENQDLPKGLRPKKSKNRIKVGYYLKNPFYGVKGVDSNSKKTLLMGYDRPEAIKKANVILVDFDKYKLLVAQVTDDPVITKTRYAESKGFKKPNFIAISTSEVSTVLELVEKYLQEITRKAENKVISPKYKRSESSYISRIGERWGHIPLEFVVTINIQTHLNEIMDSGKDRSAKAFNDAYKRLLNYGKDSDLIYFNENPATRCTVNKAKPKRSRLSTATALDVINSSELSYLPNKLSIELAYCIGLRPLEASLIRNHKGDDWDQKVLNYANTRLRYENQELNHKEFVKVVPYSYIDESGALIVFSLKTGEMSKISLDLLSPVTSEPLRELIYRIQKVCNVDGCHLLLHHTMKNGKINPGDPINPGTLSKKFTRAIKELNYNWTNGSHPTLFETRSLAIRGKDIPTVETKTPENSVNVQVSTVSEKVQSLPLITIHSKLGGHTPKSKMIKEIYSKQRDLPQQFASGIP